MITWGINEYNKSETHTLMAHNCIYIMLMLNHFASHL